MFGLNIGELILLVLVVILVFGIGRLPQIGETIGKMRLKRRKSLTEGDVIDITPNADQSEKRGE